MKETRFFYVPNINETTSLPEEEAKHAVRVLRMKAGDEMMIMDGMGTYYRAEITRASSHECLFCIKEAMSPRMSEPCVCSLFQIEGNAYCPESFSGVPA